VLLLLLLLLLLLCMNAANHSQTAAASEATFTLYLKANVLKQQCNAGNCGSQQMSYPDLLQRIQMQPPRAIGVTLMQAGTLSAPAPGTVSAKP